MSNEKVIIIGAGGHSKVVIDALLSSKKYEIIGFLDDGNTSEVLGIKKIGSISEINKFENTKFHIAIGNNEIRRKISEIIPKEKLLTIIHRTAYIAKDTFIKEGCYVGANVVINPGAKIGKCSIINTGSIVEHDCILEEFTHLSYRVLVGSGSKVRKNVYVEMGIIIKREKEVERDIR